MTPLFGVKKPDSRKDGTQHPTRLNNQQRLRKQNERISTPIGEFKGSSPTNPARTTKWQLRNNPQSRNMTQLCANVW